MTTKKDITLEVLREIRDEIRSMRGDFTERIDATNAGIHETNERLGGTNERLGEVEIGLLDIAQQQRFVVRYLRAMSERDHRFEADLAALRTRVEAIEGRLDR